ncbi:MAG: hypothetical protein ACRYF6_14625, partial [Janthinobacterium lividum]
FDGNCFFFMYILLGTLSSIWMSMKPGPSQPDPEVDRAPKWILMWNGGLDLVSICTSLTEETP